MREKPKPLWDRKKWDPKAPSEREQDARDNRPASSVYRDGSPWCLDGDGGRSTISFRKWN
jgi:hypothetical protein